MQALLGELQAWSPVERRAPGEHTLVVVREFRRVPLHASALALLLLTARAGSAAPVVAALAHFVERAVSVYQPAYLLLAHSLETPRLSMLMLGVYESAALQAAGATPFSIDTLLPAEYVVGRVKLRRKILRYEPAVVAMVGVTVFRAMFPERKGPVALGLQPETIGETAVFVLPNPSGRNANFTYAEMRAAFRGLKRYLNVTRRRA